MLISDGMDTASATEVVDLDSIPDRAKPNTIKIGIYRSFYAWRSALKGTLWSHHSKCGNQECEKQLHSKAKRSLCYFSAKLT